MQLKNILFFSDTINNVSELPCQEELKRHGLSLFCNPIHYNKELSLEETLLVADTKTGVSYAVHNQIPYIEKWTEAQMSASSFKPVCYYDDILSLTYGYLENQWRRAHHLPLTIATTSRIHLQELTLEDIPVLYQIRETESIRKILPPLDSLEIELEKHRHYITCQYEFFDYGLWGVFLLDGTLIGQAGIENMEYNGNTMLELSYLIAKKYQQQGYATETILSIYKYVSESLEINQLAARIAGNNLPSIRTAMNLGMKRKESTLYRGFQCNYYIQENIHDFLIFYESEQKRRKAAKSAFQSARKHPVQKVYGRYFE